MSWKKCKVFFLGELKVILQDWCLENQVELLCFLLIDFLEQFGILIFIFDVIFYIFLRFVLFSLIICFFFLEVKYVVIGKVIVKYFEQEGFQLDFIGKYLGQLEKVVVDFCDWLGDWCVLFFIFDVLLRSISLVILEGQ